MMGKVTSISYQKNKSRVNLYIDNSFFCGLMTETLLANGIKVGSEINEEKLRQVIFESEIKRGNNYAFNLVAKKPYTKTEMLKKLKDKNFSDNVIFEIIAKLEDYKLLDDIAYAKNYCAMANLQSRRAIAEKLYKKGIKKDNVENAVKCIKDDDERAKIDIISAKYMKNKPILYENLQRLYRYLMSKGFDYELVKLKVDEYRNMGDVDDEGWS